MTQTTHYQLNQWEAADQVKRTDFNADNAKIDAAIRAVDVKADGKAAQSALTALQTAVNGKGNCKIAFGSYVGDGNAEAAISLTFGFQPKLVLVVGDAYFLPMPWGADSAQAHASHSYTVNPVWRVDGVSWTLYHAYENPAYGMLNDKGKTYLYVALG